MLLARLTHSLAGVNANIVSQQANNFSTHHESETVPAHWKLDDWNRHALTRARADFFHL